MPVPARFGAVLFARAVERVAAFYESVFDLTVVRADVEHTVLEGSGFQLVIHATSTARRSTVDTGAVPERREDVPLKLFLPVESLAQARASAAEHGGRIASVEKEWVLRGARVCDGVDPEGNVVQCRERIGVQPGA